MSIHNFDWSRRMKHRFLHIALFAFLLPAILRPQPYAIGDTVKEFTASVCANGDEHFSSDSLDGDKNAGNFSVTWITFFASW